MRIYTDSPENFGADGYAPIIQKLGYVLGNECAEVERALITGMTSGKVVWDGVASKSNGWEVEQQKTFNAKGAILSSFTAGGGGGGGGGGSWGSLTPSSLDPKICSEAKQFAELSEFIYQCDKPKCTNTPKSPWVIIDESRAEFTFTQDKINITINDPIGFHAIAVRNTETGQIAIIYEGTNAASINDWISDFGHVITVPPQYSSAQEFAGKVFKDTCHSDINCINKIIVGGHSLGGGLAHYVALDHGLKAYIFNPAGLWGPTAKNIDTSMAAKSDSTIFVGKGVRDIGAVPTDIVSKTGVQFNAKVVEVPIELPGDGKGIDVLSDYLSLHSIENLKNWLSASCASLAIEPVSISKDQTPLEASDTTVTQKTEQRAFQLQDAMTSTKVLGKYEYISDISSDWKPKKLIGTITLTDVGLTLDGKKLKQQQIHSSVLFYDVYNQAQSSRRTSYTGAYLGHEEVIVNALTYNNATWGTKHEVVTFSPLWSSDYKTPLIFQTKNERDKFASDLSSAYKSWSVKYAGQIQQYFARIKQEKIEEQKRQAAQVQAKFDNEIANIKASVERLFKDKKGTLKELATAVNIDEKRTLQILEEGVELTLPRVEGIQSVKVDGEMLYQTSYRAKSLIEEAVYRQRQQRLNTKFTWADWFDATSFRGAERELSLGCLFKKASDVPDKEVIVKTILQSFNSNKSNVSISLKCGY